MSTRTLYVAQKGNAIPLTIPVRNLEPNKVRVKVYSIGINPVDWYTIDNNLADGAGQGNDFSGEVVEIGSEVKSTKVGDTVAGGVGGGDIDNKENGSFTDLLTVDEHLLFKFPYKLEKAGSDEVPTGIPKTFEQAASLGIAVDTNVIAFENHSHPKPSDWALIYGVTGSLGFVAAQFALNLGYKVIGVSSPSPEIVDQLKGIHWIDRNDSDWGSKARSIANNHIVFAYDTIGKDDSPNKVFKTLTDVEDSYNVFSSPRAGPSEEVVKTNPKGHVEYPIYFLLMQEIKKFGTTSMPNETSPYERAPELLKQVNNYFAKNQLKSLNVKVIHGLDKISEALALSRKGVRGIKVVVNVD